MITLVLMNSDEYQKYISSAIKSYAEEKVLAGNWNQEESISKAEAEYKRLLPNGEKTESNFLYTILDEAKTIGFFSSYGILSVCFLHTILIGVLMFISQSISPQRLTPFF
ncbi:hypothetical protein P5G62_009595 [Neobacillus sp. 179-C4.2 HS]|uniref:Uncharacterized protein n=1 Tax=Neobacillus driksii TaxID=3035913 RepID=A0ABV4YU30_9BACI|nr:hypothetical protein [Neobacillus sp. 179.-C4.2 HS]MDP5194935.1 hypothetical protein [Neobacillus sp. 179.-C4.2 HS]